MQSSFVAGRRIPERKLLSNPAAWQSALDAQALKGEKEIARLFAQFADSLPLLPGDPLYGTSFDVDAVLRRVNAQNPLLEEALVAHLIETAAIGASVVAAEFASAAAGASQYHTWAAEWARQYAGALVTRISETTRQRIRSEIADWITTGEPLSALRNRLMAPGLFGLERAKLIAQTESTFAFTEGQFDFYERALGYSRRPSERPPAHPGCRCFVSTGEERERIVYVWYTVVDDRVCRICQPKHLEVIGDAGPRSGRVWSR